MSNAPEHNHLFPSDNLSTCPACFWEQAAKKPFMTTFTGRRLNPMDLQPEDIDIRDIAHHLACINRWCGALKEPISVAQHSVHVAWLCRDTGLEMEALLHDATEAYLGDVTKWVKSHASMEFYRQAEDKAHRVICSTFKVDPRIPDIVEHADRMMINIEGAFGFPEWRSMPGFPVPTPLNLYDVNLTRAWHWSVAESIFLNHFKTFKLLRAGGR